jgi:hypothetical protein
MMAGEKPNSREARLAEALRSNLRRRKAGGGAQAQPSEARAAPEQGAPDPVKTGRD